MIIKEIQRFPPNSSVGQLYFAIARPSDQLLSLTNTDDPFEEGMRTRRNYMTNLFKPIFYRSERTPQECRPISENNKLNKAYQICKTEQAFLSQTNHGQRDNSYDRDRPHSRRYEKKSRNNNKKKIVTKTIQGTIFKK